MIERERPTAPARVLKAPKHHRTVDRITRIVEEVVYRPGLSAAEIAHALDAPKSTVYGFLGGLIANGWVSEVDRRYFLGPALYGLTLASGQIRAGLVTRADLQALHNLTACAVFLGVRAGDNLIYVAEIGSDPVTGFDALSNIRRRPLATAGGKALLAALPAPEREAYLRRRVREESALVHEFLEELHDIQSSRIAMNTRQHGQRFALATTVSDARSQPVAAVTIVGAAADLQPRSELLAKTLLASVESWQRRPQRGREAI
jgi:DNA-binding IclR family transcriptional regulator